MNRKVTSLLAMYSMFSSMANSSLPVNHYHDHEYRNKVKTHYKGMSAEEMGTAHKKKRKRRKR